MIFVEFFRWFSGQWGQIGSYNLEKAVWYVLVRYSIWSYRRPKQCGSRKSISRKKPNESEPQPDSQHYGYPSTSQTEMHGQFIYKIDKKSLRVDFDRVKAN